MGATMSDVPGLFDDCWEAAEFARQRRLSERQLRLEREKGLGPPYFKDGRRIYYPISSAREWLLQKMRKPVRESLAPKPPRPRQQIDAPPTCRVGRARSLRES
jgi:hypothetical protein